MHAVPKFVDEVGRRLQRQARLAAPAGTGQRDQARRREQVLDRAELAVAPDEAAQWDGQAMPRRGGGRRARRGHRPFLSPAPAPNWNAAAGLPPPRPANPADTTGWVTIQLPWPPGSSDGAAVAWS